MRTHAIYLVVIVALLVFGYGGWLTLEKQRAENYRLSGNVSALIADTTEKAAKLVLSKKELAQYSKPTADKVTKFEKQTGGKVREIQVIKYLAGSVVHDTVFLNVSNSTPLTENPCCELQIFEFPHGCVTSVVTYDPMNNGITDSLFGEIRVDRYVLAEKPRWRIVKPRMWNSRNWPTSVRVENNCGLQIKENTIFEID